MGGLLPLESFKRDFGLPAGSSGFASAKVAEVSANVVSLLTAGCFFGSISAALANERFGRRYSLMAYGLIFMIGASLQVSSPKDIRYIYAGRVIAGLGVGGMSAITPVYVAEAAPADVRGRITGLFQEFLVLGSTIAYWLNYGVERNLPSNSMQWRVPLGIQIIPAGTMILGLVTLKESPRWLAEKERDDEARAALAYIRREEIGSEQVLRELSEIKASLVAVNSGHPATWRECLKPDVRNRFLLIFALMLCQQLTGTNSIGYYAPQIFQTVGLSGADASLFATGIYGIVKLVFTAISLLLVIDKVGRKWAHIAGGIWMSVIMFIFAAVLATHPPQNDGQAISSASIAMCALIYLYVIGYTGSWGPGPWIYAGEIFPTQVRSYGVASAAATQWLFNFMVTRVTPQIINNIGWKVFLVFGSPCFGMSIFTFFFMKETKGLTLEELNIHFGGNRYMNEVSPKDMEENQRTGSSCGYDVTNGLSPVRSDVAEPRKR
ncbi:hypothetical protein QQS21_007328 [Conoideocrella luteorostrata]|uniref:Major facilitator superfamily (MFS) profile domain-containing protein n=1 Tax=Conoideocrella luteorostrata TaxID=1105319 RepID=A0AAJ0CLB3_9HYPO|nr:hypothetical protein QQS21_007328 [Conoideocrella luteorostrata]